MNQPAWSKTRYWAFGFLLGLGDPPRSLDMPAMVGVGIVQVCSISGGDSTPPNREACGRSTGSDVERDWHTFEGRPPSAGSSADWTGSGPGVPCGGAQHPADQPSTGCGAPTRPRSSPVSWTRTILRVVPGLLGPVSPLLQSLPGRPLIQCRPRRSGNRSQDHGHAGRDSSRPAPLAPNRGGSG